MRPDLWRALGAWDQRIAALGLATVGPRLLLILISTGMIGACTPGRPRSAVLVAARLAFEDVTVVDVVHGRLLPHQTVMVEKNHIQLVGPRPDVRLPSGTRVVKAQGKYLIPGLWDMHVHPLQFSQIYYPLFIANGVTGIRDMSTPFLDSVMQWRRDILAGIRVGPRIITAGPSLVVPDEHPGVPWGVEVATPARARQIVDSLKAGGADFLKMYEDHSRDMYFAIASEARRAGLPLAGHLPVSITAEEASDSGQRSIEHMSSPNAWLVDSRCIGAEARVKECMTLVQRFTKNKTWFTPTVLASRSPGGVCVRARLLLRGRELRDHWPDSIVVSSAPDSKKFPLPNDSQLEQDQQRISARCTQNPGPYPGTLSTMHRSGMPILAGSDAAPIFVQLPPGYSLHGELEALVLEGLTPLAALQAATLNPAAYLDATDSLGIIAPGKLADLVLLDANPLADIRNTTKIRAVVANGRFFDRDALDALIAGIGLAPQ